jgi:probable HAF family extracellular repeat protein
LKVFNMRSTLLFFALHALLLWNNHSHAALTFQAIDLGALPSDFPRSEAHAINNAGQVVGQSNATNSNRAIQWTSPSSGSQMTDLGVLPEMRSAQAFGINDRGQTVGMSVNGDRMRAFLWSPTTPNATTGSLVELNNMHGERNRTRASAINDAGQVVGSTDGDAFLWTPFVPNGSSGESVDLGDLPGGANSSFAMDINATGHVVGASDTDLGDRAFLWSPFSQNGTAGHMIDLGSLADEGRSFAAAINDAGAIAGSSSTATGGEHAVLWSADTRAITDLGDLPGGLVSSAAADINALGHVVGHSNSATTEHAFLWTPDTGMRDLNSLLDPASDSAWTLYYAQSINDSGHIVGWGDYDPDGPGEQFTSVIHAFLLTPTATPSADSNADGAIDAADYVALRKTSPNFATTYPDWRAAFGTTPSTAATTSPVPEPSSIALATAATLALLVPCRIRAVGHADSPFHRPLRSCG